MIDAETPDPELLTASASPCRELFEESTVIVVAGPLPTRSASVP